MVFSFKMCVIFRLNLLIFFSVPKLKLYFCLILA